MQNVLVPRSVSRCGAKSLRSTMPHAVAATSPVGKPVGDWDAGYQFVDMLESFRPSGGLARGPEVFALFARLSGADVGTLAGWIVNRRVICFEWQARVWLPLFQFNRSDMSPQAGLRDVLQVLTPDFEPWQVAQWFARPNSGLSGQSPCDALAEAPLTVLHAARAESPGVTH